MRYSDHKARWMDCARCLLADQRKRMVFARGKIPCDLLLVGEAPGASEDVLGRPFVGPAGHLLDKILETALAPSVRYCITNLVCCFPKEAKATGDHAPPKEAIEACAPRLAELYSLCRPRALVTVGDLASQHVLPLLFGPKAPVKTRRTHLRQVGILHPAAILRLDIAQRPLAIRRVVIALETIAGALS